MPPGYLSLRQQHANAEVQNVTNDTFISALFADITSNYGRKERIT